jgi:hypothetical protein
VDKREWLGSYLPIITVVGKELNVDGEIVRKGLVRDLKDPARMVNYSYSAAVETLALQNKVPYMAAAEAIEGYEDIWSAANLENRAYLPFNALDDNGNPIPRPERQAPAMLPSAQVQMLQLSTEEMRAASGQQNANFGIRSEASSGVGIQRLKAQGEIATFHFPDNLSRALTYEMRVLVDLIPKVYDTARVVRILGLDGRETTAMLDPEMEQAFVERDAENEAAVNRAFNPLVGRYDVAIDTGPSYQTQRQEAADALTSLAQTSPQIMQMAGDIVMRALDFPFSDELAKRMEKSLPPELRDQKPGDQTQLLEQQLGELIQKDKQAKALIGRMKEELEKLEAEKRDKVVEREIRLIEAGMKRETDTEKAEDAHAVNSYKAETERLKALGGAMTPEALRPIIQQLLIEMLSGPEIEGQERIEAPEGDEIMPMMAATGANPGLAMPMAEPQPPGEM